MRQGTLTLGLMLCCGAVGCIPMQMVESPAVRGRVVDAATGQPVSGEADLIGPQRPSREAGPSSKVQRTSTDADGQFAFQETYFTWWRPLLLPVDLMAAPFEVRICAEGHATTTCYLNNAEPQQDLGTIRLNRKVD